MTIRQHLARWFFGRLDRKRHQKDPDACVDPSAPVVECAVCRAPVHTCERDIPTVTRGGMDYTCPVHQDGVEAAHGIWVCSSKCWDTWQEEHADHFDFGNGDRLGDS
jgi:hypothetical protein